MRLTELHVQGFKSLVDAKIPLRPLMVMIGPNGSGKTALLEVFQLLQAGARKELSNAIEGFGGFEVILSKTLSSPQRLNIALRIDTESQRFPEAQYSFELVPHTITYKVTTERLKCPDATSSEPTAYYARDEGGVAVKENENIITGVLPITAISSELALLYAPVEIADSLKDLLGAVLFFSSLDASRRATVRLPQLLTPAIRPGPDGENLYSALYNLRDAHHETYERIEDTLRAGFPGFRTLKFPVVGAGYVTMTWHQDDLTTPLYPNQLSEGTLRFLWLATILLAPDPPPIVLIDEPEVSLHPQLLMLLAGLLQDAALRGQVIVATHSSDLIHWLKPEEVVVLDKVDGRTQFTWADSLNLDEWLDEFTLRDLWLMGNLGGRS